MPATARMIRDSVPPRRSQRLRKVHMLYDEDSDKDSLSLKSVKIEVSDLDEALSPSTSAVNVPSPSDKDGEQDFHNISLKDLRAQCKSKNRKASKITSDGPDITHQTQILNIEDEKIKEEYDLDKPLIAFKQKRQKTSPSKANKNLDIITSSRCAVKVEDTTSEIIQTPTPVQTSLFEAGLHDPVIEKVEGRPADMENSTVATDCIKEIVGEEDCCVRPDNPVEPLVHCETSDVLNICSEEAGTLCRATPSCADRNSFQYSAVELQQVPKEDDQCISQPCFINQPTKSTQISDSIEACGFNDVAEKDTNNVSLLDLIDEASDHQKTPEEIVNLDTDKYSVANGFSVCFVNQSCDDYMYDDEYWNTEVVEGNEQNTQVVEGNEPESVTILEEFSPMNEPNTDLMSPVVAIQSDLCGSTDMKCTSLEEVVQMQRDSPMDTTVCCDVRPKHILQDEETEHSTTDYTFVFDKTHDLAPHGNFFTQDGRLESIVYEALNSHTQKMTSENTSSVGSDTSVVQSPDFTVNCPGDEISLPNYVEQSLKDMNMFRCRLDYGITKSVSNEGSGELQAQFSETCVNKETTSRELQAQLSDTCVNKETTSPVPLEISIAEETHEVLVKAPDSSATYLETENQNVKSEVFIAEKPVEEHGPKKLFSKRKIMSPTSQEKLCNALNGIDLYGVKRLKNDIIIEGGLKSRISSPQPAHNQERSAFIQGRRLSGRVSVSPTSKGVPKSVETSSNQQTTCSCKSSQVVLDTEKAVEFSQRQMHDIENIAAKLIRSLKHMRSIVDETLSSEGYSLVPNVNISEIRAASEDALEVEKTTRKWLSIMNKDCNRFCKILTLAKKNDGSAHEAPRKKRKITFADEAGGKLCHVKVFKDGDSCLLSECQSDL